MNNCSKESYVSYSYQRTAHSGFSSNHFCPLMLIELAYYRGREKTIELMLIMQNIIPKICFHSKLEIFNSPITDILNAYIVMLHHLRIAICNRMLTFMPSPRYLNSGQMRAQPP